MAMEVEPIQSLPPLCSGKGGVPKTSDDKTRRLAKEKKGSVEDGSASPSMKLRLEIGGCSAVIKPGKHLFTAAQLHELQQQALIFRYIVAGLHVPPALVIPIWENVTGQLTTVVGYSHQGFNFQNMVDPEPARCKRTDGKKWRCSKNVIPHQKYCERHMHRGCRSRKPVEGCQTSAAFDTTLSKNSSKNSDNAFAKFSNVNCVSPNPGNSSSNVDIKRPVVMINTSIDCGRKKSGITITASVIKEHKNTTTTKITNAVDVDNATLAGRCRRTDGKKWRCSKNVISHQKYCERHMYRGCRSRKPVEAGQTSAAFDTTLSKNSSKNSDNSIAKISNLNCAGPQPNMSHKAPVNGSSSVDIKSSSMKINTRTGSGQKKSGINITVRANNEHKNTTTTMITNAVCMDSATLATTESSKGSSINMNSYNIDDQSITFSNYVGHLNNKRSDRDFKVFEVHKSEGLDFSPKSVLQAQDCGASCFCTNGVELEPGRCRRTDGKKWRCRRAVVPSQKYCTMHMYRGSKKFVQAS